MLIVIGCVANLVHACRFGVGGADRGGRGVVRAGDAVQDSGHAAGDRVGIAVRDGGFVLVRAGGTAGDRYVE